MCLCEACLCVGIVKYYVCILRRLGLNFSFMNMFFLKCQKFEDFIVTKDFFHLFETVNFCGVLVKNYMHFQNDNTAACFLVILQFFRHEIKRMFSNSFCSGSKDGGFVIRFLNNNK